MYYPCFIKTLSKSGICHSLFNTGNYEYSFGSAYMAGTLEEVLEELNRLGWK